jgi:hypothetical protein
VFSDEYTSLMAVLLFCHFLGDFTHLSTPSMLRAKRTGTAHGWILAHAAVHGVLVGGAVLLIVRPGSWIVMDAVVIELVTHFVIDEVRARSGVIWPRLGDSSAGVEEGATDSLLIANGAAANGI